MRRFMMIACLAGSVSLPAGAAAAQELANPEGTRDLVQIERFGLELLTGGISGTKAEEAGTGERVWGIQLNLGFTAFRVLSLNTDLGVLSLHDERPFSQETTGGEKSSSASGVLGSVSVGLRTPPLAVGGRHPVVVTAGVNRGGTWMKANRSISECVDCAKEPVELHAGKFWEADVHVILQRQWGISARYRTYEGGSGLRDALMVGVTLAP